MHGTQDEQATKEDATAEHQSQEVSTVSDAPAEAHDEHKSDDCLHCDAGVGSRQEEFVHGVLPVICRWGLRTRPT